MTLEQRVRRAERMLVIMAQSGRRTRSEWGYKIDSIIHAQMKGEDEARGQRDRINMLIQSQMETTEQIRSLAAGQAELSQSQKLTERSLRALIDTLRRGQNGNSST